jgi:endoglucanase
MFDRNNSVFNNTQNSTVMKKKLILFGLGLLGCIGTQSVFSQSSDYGVNLAGLEFGTTVPGVIGTDFFQPTTDELDYYKSKGLKVMRIPFLWERVQPILNGALDPTYLGYIDNLIASAKVRGISIILDVHNYCRYNSNIIGATGSPVTITHFQNLWSKLAAHYNKETTVWAYGLMNEPNSLGSRSLWFKIAQAGISSIRTVDAVHPILVCGDFWAHSDLWKTYSDTLKYLKDPANKIIYEAHQYFDSDGSGTYASTSFSGNGMNVNSGVTLVAPFVNWLKANNKKGFMGEYGIPNNAGADQANWNTLLNNFLNYLSQNCVGGTAWAGGPGWGNDVLALDSVNNADRPPMAVLMKYSMLASTCSGKITAVSTMENSNTTSRIYPYPNPNNGLFFLKDISLNDDISVMNTVGEEVFKIKVASLEQEIDLTKLEKGLYVIQVISNKNYSYGKLIID